MTLAMASGSAAPAITSGGRNALFFAVAISCALTSGTGSQVHRDPGLSTALIFLRD